MVNIICTTQCSMWHPQAACINFLMQSTDCSINHILVCQWSEKPIQNVTYSRVFKRLSNWFLRNSWVILHGVFGLIYKPVKINLQFVCFLLFFSLILFVCLNTQEWLCGLLRSSLLLLQLFCTPHSVHKPYTGAYWFRLFLSIFKAFIFIYNAFSVQSWFCF